MYHIWKSYRGDHFDSEQINDWHESGSENRTWQNCIAPDIRNCLNITRFWHRDHDTKDPRNLEQSKERKKHLAALASGDPNTILCYSLPFISLHYDVPRLGVADTAFFQKMNIFIEWIIRLFFEWMNSLNEYFWFSFEWINSLNEYFRRTIEWIIEWIRKVRYSYEKWTKSAFFGRNGPLLPVFHCFLKLWFVFQFEWIILLNEYFLFNFEWIILLNEYSWFNFELNIVLNHFLARFNVKMNDQNLSPCPSCSWRGHKKEEGDPKKEEKWSHSGKCDIIISIWGKCDIKISLRKSDIKIYLLKMWYQDLSVDNVT